VRRPATTWPSRQAHVPSLRALVGYEGTRSGSCTGSMNPRRGRRLASRSPPRHLQTRREPGPPRGGLNGDLLPDTAWTREDAKRRAKDARCGVIVRAGQAAVLVDLAGQRSCLDLLAKVRSRVRIPSSAPHHRRSDRLGDWSFRQEHHAAADAAMAPMYRLWWHPVPSRVTTTDLTRASGDCRGRRSRLAAWCQASSR
jgi:hypothetical protein